MGWVVFEETKALSVRSSQGKVRICRMPKHKITEAKMIAATPELLAECQRSLDMLLEWSKSDAWKRADPGFVNMKWRLENVIKKANGDT